MAAPKPLSLQTAKPPPLTELVYRQVRDAIMNGVFAPGQMLRQEEVAAALGVSRNPLREVLPRLESEGQVVLYPRRGYAVISLDPADIEEVFDLRVLLDTQLAKAAIARRTEKDVKAARDILRAMAGLIDAHGVDDRATWFRLNAEFHDALHAPAGRKYYMRALEMARGLLESYIRMEVNLTGDMQQAHREHEALVDAFAAGDARRFVALTKAHGEHTKQRLLQGLSKQ